MEDLLKHLIQPQAGRHASTTTAATGALQQDVGHAQHRNHQVSTIHPAVLQYLLNNPLPTAVPQPLIEVNGTSATSQDPRRIIPPPDNSAVAVNPNTTPDSSSVSALPAGPKKSDDVSKLICAFWYHFGSCRNDPNSKDYKASSKVCKFVHHLGPGTEMFKVQRVPSQWHKNACGLERCEQRHGEKNHDVSGRKFAVKRKTGNAKAGNAVSATPKTSNHQAQPKRATLSRAQGQDERTALAAKGNKKESSKRKRKRSDNQTGPMTTQSKSVTVPSRPKLPIKYSRQVGKTAKANEQETCFFWYHGSCKRGKNCSLLHALTSPPSFVQPPPDYMHYVPCGLEWCPDDHKFEHGQQIERSHQQHHTKKACLKDGINKAMKEDVAENGAIYLKYDDGSSNGDQDWFLAGFPDA